MTTTTRTGGRSRCNERRKKTTTAAAAAAAAAAKTSPCSMCPCQPRIDEGSMICIASVPEKTFREEEEEEEEEGEDPAGRLERGRRGWRTSRWLPGNVVHSSMFIRVTFFNAQPGV